MHLRTKKVCLAASEMLVPAEMHLSPEEVHSCTSVSASARPTSSRFRCLYAGTNVKAAARHTSSGLLCIFAGTSISEAARCTSAAKILVPAEMHLLRCWFLQKNAPEA